MHYDLWLALSQTGKDTLIPLLDDAEYDGPHLTAVKIFRKVINLAGIERMYKTPTINSKVWYLYSVVFNDLSGDAKQKAQDAISYLETNYPGNFVVVGAWKWDGLQVGQQWELDQDGNRTGGVTGTPTYPLHPRLIDFMPDVWDYTDPENPALVPATDLADVRLVQGQAPRRFT